MDEHDNAQHDDELSMPDAQLAAAAGGLGGIPVVGLASPDGAMGAGTADAPDIAHDAGGDATGGGDPGDPDAMGADDERTVEEGAGRTPEQTDFEGTETS